MHEEFNHYLAPSTVDEAEPPEVIDTRAEARRRAHLGRESGVRAIGAIGYFLATLLGTLTVVGVIQFLVEIIPEYLKDELPEAFSSEVLPPVLIALVIDCLFTWLAFAIGRGLRRFRPTAITAAIMILSTLGAGLPLYAYWMASARHRPGGMGLLALLGFIPATGAFYLTSTRTRELFTPEYRDVVAKTPHLGRPSRRAKIGLIVALATFATITAAISWLS